MLNLEQIAQRINNPNLCEVSDIDDLKLFTNNYPYAQVFPILYLKALSNNNDIRFEDELSNYAYRISDRAQLYNLIHPKQTNLVSSNHPTNEIEIDTIEIPVISIIQEKESIELIEENIELQENSALIELTSENSEKSEELFSEPEYILEKESFDKEILSLAISTSYNLDHLEDKEAPAEPKIEESEITIVQISSEKRSFSSWLQANDRYFEPQIDEEKARIDAIVNQFIKDDPKLSRPSKEEIEDVKPKTEFFSPVKKAKESLEISTMPVSETLAKIFALQGNFPKAIFAYEQLSLINPEKKIFFASRIEELKKKLNT